MTQTKDKIHLNFAFTKKVMETTQTFLEDIENRPSGEGQQCFDLYCALLEMSKVLIENYLQSDEAGKLIVLDEFKKAVADMEVTSKKVDKEDVEAIKVSNIMIGKKAEA